ncbi:MAG: hypothetical protein KGQ40_09915 [Rhodospirillales bacterium]|nr:hypothetical protein [Rhodospirillales bacterium]
MARIEAAKAIQTSRFALARELAYPAASVLVCAPHLPNDPVLSAGCRVIAFWRPET